MIVETSDKNQFYYFMSWIHFISWPTPTWPWRSLTANISDKIIDTDVNCWQHLESSFKMALSNFWINIFFLIWNLCDFHHDWNFVNFRQCFFNIHPNRKFLILMVSSKRSCSGLSNHFFLLNLFFIYTNPCLDENFRILLQCF